MKKEVVEYCSECENEVILQWDTEEDGFEIVCPYCGKKLMLCDECQHTVCEDGEPHDCDWDETCGECHRCKCRIAAEEAELVKKSERSKVRRAAYERFKLWWCMSHGVTMAAIFSVAAEFVAKDAGDMTAENIDDFLSEVGFAGGSLYPCFSEFLHYEYMDAALMRLILDPPDFEKYLELEGKEEPDILGDTIKVETPLGTIVAKDQNDPDYPGVSLFFVPKGGDREEAGGVMEYSLTFHQPNQTVTEEKVAFRFYSKEKPYDEPTHVFEIT